jgi:hypothetical protein
MTAWVDAASPAVTELLEREDEQDVRDQDRDLRPASKGVTELNFKFYRQATNKIAGISDEAAAFLRGFFSARLT